MNAHEPIFGEHPSQVLKDAYQGYQGCKPEDAKVIFLGKDPVCLKGCLLPNAICFSRTEAKLPRR